MVLPMPCCQWKQQLGERDPARAFPRHGTPEGPHPRAPPSHGRLTQTSRALRRGAGGPLPRRHPRRDHLISPRTIVARGSLDYPTAPIHEPWPVISLPKGGEEPSGSAGNLIPAGGRLQHRPKYSKEWEGNSYYEHELSARSTVSWYPSTDGG